MKKGDIAHLPSGVLLQQMEGGIPFRYHNVKKPASVVVIESMTICAEFYSKAALG